MEQALEGSFSAVSTPIFASKYSFCNIFRDLQDYQSGIPIFANFQCLLTVYVSNILLYSVSVAAEAALVSDLAQLANPIENFPKIEPRLRGREGGERQMYFKSLMKR